MKRHLAIATAAATLLAAGLSSFSAQAGSGSAGAVRTQKVVPQQLEVVSNGSSYTKVGPFGNIVADVWVGIKTGGTINSWKTWLRIGTQEGDDTYQTAWADFSSYAFLQSYQQGEKPSKVDRVVQVIIPATAYQNFAVSHCNAMASRLRADGLSDKQIFAQDRTIELGVRAELQWDSNPFGAVFDSYGYSDGELGWADIEKFDLVCKKWNGPAIPQAVDDLSVEPPRVEQASLSLLERSGRNGVCKIILSGVIQTSQADVDVSFRYKDNVGHQSEVYSVTTDHAKTAMFSHEYDIPNNPDGGESGKVRMVGVSHDFTSAWSDYEMNCVAPATDSFQALLPPTVEMQVVPIEKVMVGRQLCVSKLKLIAKAVGRSATMSGQGAFVGDYYISQPQAYEIEQDEIVLFGAERELDWTPDPQSFEAAAPTPADHPKSQTVMIGFNLTGENNTVVASVPKKPYTYTCVFPTVNPAVVGDNGEMSAAPRPNPAPSKSPQLRLAPRAGDGASRQPATPPEALRRLRQKPQGANEPTAPVRRKPRLRLKQ